MNESNTRRWLKNLPEEDREAVISSRRAAERERHRKANALYAIRHPDRVRKRNQAWQEKNKEKRHEYNRRWKAENKEQHEDTYKRWFSQPRARIATLITNRVADSARRGIVCDEVALRELLDPPTKCAFCGVDIDFTAKKGKLRNGPSIDRVDTRRGYVKGNIALLCNAHNEMKGKATADEHRKFAEFIELYSSGTD